MIDVKQVQAAMAEYQEARRLFNIAKDERKQALAELEVKRNEIEATYRKAFNDYIAAGEAFTKFDDAHPDEDEEIDEDGEPE
jgi:multidrug efflux pump subunit AcrA (membrane-fusion protein)